MLYQSRGRAWWVLRIVRCSLALWRLLGQSLFPELALKSVCGAKAFFWVLILKSGKSYRQYRRYAERYPDVHVIDGEKPVEEVYQEVVSLLRL